MSGAFSVIPGVLGAIAGAVGLGGSAKKGPKAPEISPVDVEKDKEEEQRKQRLRRALAFGQRNTILTNPLGATQPVNTQRTVPTLQGQ